MLQTWKAIFSILDLETPDDLSAQRSHVLDTDWRCPALRSMLCYAVSEECEGRQEYIARILALNNCQNDDRDIMNRLIGANGSIDVNVQHVLMKIIKRGMKVEPEDTSEIPSAENLGQDGTAQSIAYASDDSLIEHEEIAKRQIDLAHRRESDEHDASNWRLQNDLVVQLEQEVQLMKEENERLRQDCRKAKQSENDLVLEIEGMRASHRSQTLKDEADYLDREKMMRQEYDTEICQIKRQLEQTIAKCDDGERAKIELAALKDDLDVLQHSEKKLQHAEDQLRKCKEKIQELSDIKDQLLREEEAHGKAVEQILLLENELNQLQPLKRQLETYRVRATDAEVKLVESQHELEKLRHRSDHLALENTELTETSKMRINDTDQLRQKLIENVVAEDGNLHGLGEGFW